VELYYKIYMFLQTLDQEYLFAVGITVLLLLVAASYLFGKARGDKFLLIGPSGSGKTALFLKLTKGLKGETACAGTVTSMQENVAQYALPKGPKVTLVDLPGHPRLKELKDQRIFEAAALLFVVDSVEFMPNVRSIATTLYELLAHPVVRQHKMNVLVACNKIDSTAAHSTDFISKRLEKELEAVKKAVVASMNDTKGGAGYADILVGRKGEPFSFSHCKNVTFASISVAQDKVQPLEDFIAANL